MVVAVILFIVTIVVFALDDDSFLFSIIRGTAFVSDRSRGTFFVGFESTTTRVDVVAAAVFLVVVIPVGEMLVSIVEDLGDLTLDAGFVIVCDCVVVVVVGLMVRGQRRRGLTVAVGVEEVLGDDGDDVFPLVGFVVGGFMLLITFGFGFGFDIGFVFGAAPVERVDAGEVATAGCCPRFGIVVEVLKVDDFVELGR